MRNALMLRAFFVVTAVAALSFAPAHAATKKKGDDKKADDSSQKKSDDSLRTTGPANIQREDTLSNKQIEMSKAAEAKRDEAIAEIKGLLPKVAGKSQEGELVFRLAEIYWQKSKVAYQSEFKDFDDAYNKWVDAGRQGKEPQLASYTKKSDVYKKQALDNYQIVLDKFPDYPRLDEVLYIMAYNQQEAQREKEAVDNYSQLIRQYPDSEYVSDSYVQLGEYYFKHNDLQKSTKAYSKAYDVATKRHNEGTATFAYYKLAWCDYNAQGYDEALNKFKSVIKRSGGDKQGIQLKREALNDMVLTYSQLNQTKEAYDYIKKEAGADQAFKSMDKLAGIYKEQGKQPLRIDTLRMLINLDPDNVQAPDYQSGIVESYALINDRESVKKEVGRLVELYRPGSPWFRKNEPNKAATERAREVAETRLRTLVTDYHQFAQKHKMYDDYDAAASIYDQYLKAFPDNENAYRLNFFYAELLWDLGKWREAATQYDAVVKRDAKGEYTRTCAYNAVLAWEKIVNGIAPPSIDAKGKVQFVDCPPDDEKAGKCKAVRTKEKIGGLSTIGKQTIKSLKNEKKGDAKFAKQEIPPDEKSLAAACDAYVAVVPQKDLEAHADLKKELVEVKYKAGYIYQNHYDFDEAAKRFGELIDRWPDTELARSGADQILDSYAFREDYPALEKWSRDFSAKPKLMADAKFAKSVKEYMEGASFKNSDKLREDAVASVKTDPSKSIAAAEKLDGFVKEFPKSTYAPLAVYDEQLLYANVQHEDQALEAAQRLFKEYPKEIAAYKIMKTNGDVENDLKDKLEKDTYANMPAYYEKVARYKEAADWYIKFADKYKEDPHSPDSVYNAGIFYLGLGDTENAVKLFARYIKDFPKQKDLAEVYLRMAAVYEDKEDWKRAAALYGDFDHLHGKDGTPEQVLGSKYKTALMLEKAGRDKDMLEACKGLVDGWKKLDDKLKKSEVGSVAGGYCAFHVLEPEWLEYKAIKIEQKAGATGKKAMQLAGQALDLKAKKRDEVGKKYAELKEYGSAEWAIAGYLRAAEALFDYADTLRNAPDPPALKDNPEGLDLFRGELENRAFPVEEQGIQALEAALQAAFDKGVYSPYTIEIEDRLKKFKPAKFGRIYELPFFPSAAVAAPTRTAAR
jgi:TolA-binding protein